MNRILISGAGSGLGKAIALHYARTGNQICIADINEVGGKSVVEQINSTGGSAFFEHCDITKQSDIDRLSATLSERWQAVDILINNAGVATAGYLDTENLEQWQWVLDINLLGHIRMTQGILPLLRKSSATEKAVINIASQAGLTPAPGMASYSASKAAMISYSETAWLELGHEGIHVSVVCPAFFSTNLNQSLRSDDPGMEKVVAKLMEKSGISAEEIAARIASGANKKKFMIITHKQGLTAWRLKCFLSAERYLNMMKKQTKGLLKRPSSENTSKSTQEN